MKASFALLWRWSPLFTLPPALCALLFVVQVSNHYKDFGLRFFPYYNDEAASPLKLSWRHTAHRWSDSLNGPSSKGADLELSIPKKVSKSLNNGLPYSGFIYRQASLQAADEQPRPVRIKYRGDTQFHWFYPHKSYRVKTAWDAQVDGIRTFNLNVNKGFGESFSNHAAYALARQMELMAPRTNMQHIGVNGRSVGLRLMVEQTNQQFLRKQGRMPGQVYVGDQGSPREAVLLNLEDMFDPSPQTIPYVWEAPWRWEIRGYHDAYTKDHEEPLALLIDKLINDEQDLSLLDIEAFARLNAFITLAQSYHIGRQHNWKLHYDYAKARFEPIVWDPLGWFPSYLPHELQDLDPDPATTILFVRLLGERRFQVERHRSFVDFYRHKRQAFVQQIRRDIDQAQEKLPKGSVFFDLAGNRLDEKQFRVAMQAYPERIEEVLHILEAKLFDSPTSLQFTRIQQGIRIQIEGGIPTEQLRILGPLPTAPLQLRAYTKSVPVQVDLTPYLSSFTGPNGSGLRIDLPLLHDIELGEPNHRRHDRFPVQVTRQSAVYDLIFGEPVIGAVEAIEATLWTPDQRVVQGIEVDTLTPRAFGGLRDPLPKAQRSTLTWSGELHIDRDRIIDSNLHILPGTKILLAEGVLVEIRGRVDAAGTQASPIRFGPMDPNKAGGTLLIRGPGADGSSLEHCHFVGLGTKHTPMMHLSGMVSVHEVKDIRFTDCRFDAPQAEDALHLAYSQQ